jgi:class 3 adenylate cyclase/tetratricopeptide (TPR) repeat protein
VTVSCPTCRALTPNGAHFCPSCGARLETAGPEATERKVVTTLFADLVGFTALGEDHDPEDVDESLRAFFVMARSIIERFGGAVEKYIGDAVVGLFGVPRAHEDDAERAVRAALRIVAHMSELPPVGGETLRVRCAVNTGPALVRLRARPETGEGVLVGDAVNTAARLLADAPPMTVAAGAATHHLTRHAVHYEPLPALTAKGKADPVERWKAVRAIARYGADPTRHDETTTVGREVELAVLAGLLDRAVASGSPQFVVVSGEAGIGKSRLIREFFRLVDARPNVLCNWRQGGCPPYGSGLAYWALREIVSAHAGIAPGDTPGVMEQKLREAVASTGLDEWLVARLKSLMGLPTPSSERKENLAAWTRFFESIAQARPAVVVIEDLHWASESTTEFLRYFVSHASDAPLLLVGTARPEFLEGHPDVFSRVPAITHVDLKALSPGESSRLAEALLRHDDAAGLAGEIAERCGGNPLFAEELARFLTDRRASDVRPLEVEARLEAPTSVLTLIAARLDALPSEQKDLLADASVIGQVFSPAAVAAVRQADPDDVRTGLAQLEQRQFLRRHADSAMEGEVELGFWHALVRDVAYDRLPRASRAVRHLRAARWLKDRARDSDDVAEIIAHHYATGLDLARASRQTALVAECRPAAREAFVRAGDRALRLDVAAAEHYYGLATETVDDGRSPSPELLLKRGEALRAVGRSLDAADLQKEAVLLCETAGDKRRHAYALSRLAFTLTWTDPGESRRLAEQAAGMLDEAPSTESISVLETWSTLHLWQGDLPAVIRATDRILVMSGRMGQPSPPRALGLHGYARFILGDPDGLAEMVEAITTAEESGSAADLFGLREAHARCTCVAEDPDKALSSVRRWIAEAEQRRDAASVVDFGVYAARYLLLCGRWDEALAMASDLAEEGRRRENPVTEAELCAVSVAGHLGRGTPQAATRDAARFEELLPRIADEVVPFGSIAAAAVASGVGDGARVVRLLEPLPETSFASEPVDVLWWPLAVRTALATGQPALAERLADAALGWPSCPARVRLTLTAMLAEDAGRPEEAARDYAAAAEAWSSGKSPYEEGLALLSLGRCLLELGRRAEAVAALSNARVLFERIGSRLALAEIDRLCQTA